MRRLQLPPEALQEALDSSATTLQKGVQQWFTPQDLALALTSHFQFYNLPEPYVGDLFGAGQGSLLTRFTTHPSARTFAIELDPLCTPPSHHLMRGDCTQILPLLIECRAKFDLLVANPPFSLTWNVAGQGTNSTLATFQWMLQLLHNRGQGMILCNAAAIATLQTKVPHLLRHIHTTVILPNYFPNTGRWADMKLAALYLNPSHSGDQRTIDLSDLPADAATLNVLKDRLSQFNHLCYAAMHPAAYHDALPRWRAVAQEIQERQRARRAGHSLYNIVLQQDGRISTYLTPFERFTTKLDPAFIADLASLHGRHLRNLVISRSERSALEAAVLGKIWKVDPKLPTALSTAIGEYNALRAPLRPLNATQRLGYLDEHNEILCTKPFRGCKPGSRYRVATRIVEGGRMDERIRYDKKPKRPTDPPLKEEVFVSGMMLEIIITTPEGPAVFLQDPKLSREQNKDKLNSLPTLIEHFAIPEVPDAETAHADRFADAQARLMALCPATTPPTRQQLANLAQGIAPPAPPTKTSPDLAGTSRRVQLAPHPPAPPTSS